MQVNWDAMSAVGTWLGAAATFGATMVALRESARAYKPRVRAVANPVVHGPFDGLFTEGVSIVVTNVGACRVSIKGVVVRSPGREPVEVGIDQGYADFQPFRTLDAGDQIERDWPVGRFDMHVPGKRKRRLASFVRRLTGKPYRMAIVDTCRREYRVEMRGPLQKCLESAQSREK